MGHLNPKKHGREDSIELEGMNSKYSIHLLGIQGEIKTAGQKWKAMLEFFLTYCLLRRWPGTVL
jgi:hypothetical protein